MKTLYLDIFSGISGDMFIGAMLDLGVDIAQLRQEVSKLGLGGFQVHVERKTKSTVAGVKFDVLLDHAHKVHDEQAHDEHSHAHTTTAGHAHEHGHDDHGHHHHEHAHDHGQAHEHEHNHHEHAEERSFADIQQIIEQSDLSSRVKKTALAIFHRIAVAEGKIHGQPVAEVHFHEVGAIDSIVDIVGACVCLEILGWPRVLAAHVVEGHGWVDCAHGRFPVPAAATLEILGARGIAITQCDEPHELVTPTGAALLAEVVREFGPMRGLVAAKVGYGLGTRDHQTRPNVLRAVLGDVEGGEAHDWETDTVAVLETNLDDVSGQVLGALVEKALGAGALDVFHTPIQMKKHRPGTLLTVICPAEAADKFCEMILRETTSFGVRRSLLERRKLRREIKEVPTAYGAVKVKLGYLDGRIIQVAPEFEVCRELAERANVPLRRVFEAATRAAQA